MIGIPSSAAILFAGMATSAIVSGLLLYMMIGKVNRKLPDTQQMPYLFMYPGKVSKIKHEYRRLYPTSPLILVRLVLNISMVVFALTLAWRLGFFR